MCLFPAARKEGTPKSILENLGMVPGLCNGQGPNESHSLAKINIEVKRHPTFNHFKSPLPHEGGVKEMRGQIEYLRLSACVFFSQTPFAKWSGGEELESSYMSMGCFKSVSAGKVFSLHCRSTEGIVLLKKSGGQARRRVPNVPRFP